MLTIKIDLHPMPSHHLHERHPGPTPSISCLDPCKASPGIPASTFAPYSPSSTQKPEDSWESQGKSLPYSKHT